MSAIFTCLVIGVAVAMVTVNVQGAVLTPNQPPPNGTYMCSNNTVTVSFLQNQTNGLTYQRVSIEPHQDKAECFTKDVDPVTGMFVLYVTNLAACGIVPDASGVANFLVRIHYLYGYDTHQDTFTNITCNVTAIGQEQYIDARNVSITGEIVVVPGRVGQLPAAVLQALADKFSVKPVQSVILGATFWLCIEIDFSLSLFKGALVEDVFTVNPAGNNVFLIQNRCQANGVPHASVGFPTTNTTTLRIYIELKAFRFYLTAVVTFKVKLTFFKHPKIQGPTTCPLGKKRRSADDEETASRVYSVTLPVTSSNDGKIIDKEEVRIVEKTQNKDNKNAICEGHINATIFYAVVAVLAILLVMMIGVAVMFAARGRSVQVVREGKDNMAF